MTLPPYARPISATFLGHFIATPADGKHYWTAPREKKKEFDIGKLIHEIGLQGNAYEDMKIVVKQYSWATKEGKAEKAALEATESIVLSLDDAELVREQGANLARYMANFHPTTVNEHWIEWECPNTGLPCVGIIDAFDWLGLFDVKTSQDCSPKDMRMIVNTFNTGIKFAHYDAGMVATGIVSPAFWEVIIVGKTEPYCIQGYKFSAREREYWQALYIEKMAQLKVCLETDTWQKYAAYGETLEFSSYRQ